MELDVSINVHPHAEQVSVEAVENDAWLRFKSNSYTGVDVFLRPGVADAIVAALQPYVTKKDTT